LPSIRSAAFANTAEQLCYGDMLGVASYRRGIPCTPPVRAEAQVSTLGTDAAQQAGTAVSWCAIAAGGRWRHASPARHRHSSDRFSAFAQTQYASRSFVQSGMADLIYKPRQRTFAGMGFDFGRRGNVQVAYGLQSFYDSASVQTLGLSYSLSIGALGYLGLFASHSIADERNTSLLLNWTLALGDRHLSARCSRLR
jgi:hypothetical protein